MVVLPDRDPDSETRVTRADPGVRLLPLLLLVALVAGVALTLRAKPVPRERETADSRPESTAPPSDRPREPKPQGFRERPQSRVEPREDGAREQ